MINQSNHHQPGPAVIFFTPDSWVTWALSDTIQSEATLLNDVMSLAKPLSAGAGTALLVSARSSELEVSGSILGDSNVCFDFLLICVVLTLNTCKTEH